MKQKGGKRERFIAAYPGVHKVGISCWIVTGGEVSHLSVGSVEREVFPALVQRFRPAHVLLGKRGASDPRASPIALPVGTTIKWIHRKWQRVYVSPPADWNFRAGILAVNAYRMGFYQYVQRGNWRIRDLTPVRHSNLWLEAYSP